MSQEQKKPGGFSNQQKPEVGQANVSSQSTSQPSAADALAKMEAAQVKVMHGANDGTFNLAGQKVSTVRASLVDAFNIPADALSFVNGDQVDAEYVLQKNDTLEFVKQAGVKG